MSTSSVTIGTGTKVFTVDLTKGNYAATDNVRFSDSSAPSTNWVEGTVTSLVGNTLTINVPAGFGCNNGGSACTGGSGTFTAWSLTMHLPNGWFLAASIRARTGNAIGWDFRNVTENIRIDGSTFIEFEDFLVDACGLTNQDINTPLIDNRSSASYSMRYSGLDGCGYTGRLTVMVGSGAAGASPILFEYNYVRRAPLDVLNLASNAALTSVIIRYNYLQSICSTAYSYLLHADVTQVGGWDVPSLEYHNNDMRIDCAGPSPSDVTGPLNFGVTPTWSGDAYFHNNLMYYGGFSVYTTNPGGSPTGTMRFDKNYICNPAFQTDVFGNGGFLYANQATYPNISVTNVRGSCSNQQLNFKWNNGSTVTTVTQIP